MAVSSSASAERPRRLRRAIRLTAVTLMTAVTVGAIALWGAAVTVTLRKTLADSASSRHDHRELVEFALLAGGALVVVIVVAAVLGWRARRLAAAISGLAAQARDIAGQPADATARSSGKARISAAAAAMSLVQRTAAAAVASEASLREGLGQVFVSLARRNQSLLQRQLRLIDALEQKASDPAALSDLFSLDHLTTRMRRHAESLAILSGAAPGRTWRQPVPVIDVIRGAMAEVEDYTRVVVLTRADDAVTGPAVADMIHLLAELIENATLFSPSGTQVEVRAGRVANGLAIEVDDRGLGIEPDQLSEINEQMATPPDFDLARADRLGLFVGGKLAARHGVRVSLRPSPYGGTTAIVLLPNSIIVPGMSSDLQLEAPVLSRAARLDLRRAEPLALAGRRTAPPTLPPADPPVFRPDPAGPPVVIPDSPAAQLLVRDSPAAPVPDLAATGPAAPVAAADSPAWSSPVAPARPAADTYLGLPRRTRQVNMSPNLRDSPLTSVSPPEGDQRPATLPSRAPEQARDLAASLQSGWQRGRQSDVPTAPAQAADWAADRPAADNWPADRLMTGDWAAKLPAPGEKREDRPDSETPDSATPDGGGPS